MTREQKDSVVMRSIGTNLGDVEVTAVDPVKALEKAREIAHEKYPELKSTTRSVAGRVVSSLCQYREYMTALLLVIIIVSFSQTASATDLTMTHKIIVPQEYAGGRSEEALEGTSDIEDYIGAFERTWWAVMNKFAQDINWQPRHEGLICFGTPAAGQGCFDGHEEAVRRVEGFLKNHEAAAVEKFIKEKIGK
ncbi:MAG: hypothetical protein PHY29_08380 [Syntrophales bacterium]|nr:hypothetical protein [Syntrophales bacterium]